MSMGKRKQGEKSEPSAALLEASRALFLLNEKAEGKEPGAGGDLMPELQAAALVLGVYLSSPCGGTGKMLSPQLPGEAIAGASRLHSQPFLYETDLSRALVSWLELLQTPKTHGFHGTPEYDGKFQPFLNSRLGSMLNGSHTSSPL